MNLKNLRRPKLVADVKKGKAPLFINFNFKLPLEEILNGKYFWDLDGDGLWEDITEAPEATFTYQTSGMHIARAAFKDSENIELFVSTGIYVNEADRFKVEPLKNEEKDFYSQIEIKSGKLCSAEMGDGSRIILPADVITSDDVVLIKRLNGVKNPISIKRPAGEYREFSFENRGPLLEKEVTLEIPYKDIDNDGVVDIGLIDELTLDAYWYNEEQNSWELLSDTLIFPDINLVSIKTSHFSLFGLAGEQAQMPNEENPETVQDSGSSGGGSCFIATAVFGSKADEVQILYKFRNEILLKNFIGKIIVVSYYFVSPPLADFIRDKAFLKIIIYAHLKVLVEFLKIVL